MENKNYLEIPLINHLKNLFPICRSITGKGIRESLSYFEKFNTEWKRIRFSSGSKVFDWEIPDEWNINDSYIQHLDSGKKFAEFSKNNLHLMSYSIPVNKNIDLINLKDKIYSLKDQPNAIPYVTSYYSKDWGFCIEDNIKKKLPNGTYKVFIDSSLKPGFLDLSTALISGEYSKEIFFSSYLCHPSMANNELSGPVVLNALITYIKNKYPKPKYSYRFAMVPETIGSIAFISKFKDKLKDNVICGFNLSCVGDEKCFSYINTPYKNTLSDKALKAVLFGNKNVKQYSYINRGSDERQYCAPNLRLPICTFCRSKFGEYPEYHTSKDNLDLVTNKGLEESFEKLKTIIDSFEIGLYPKTKILCEPQLGKRGLYPNVSIKTNYDSVNLRMNLIAFSDGKNSIFDISEMVSANLNDVLIEYKILKKAGILEI